MTITIRPRWSLGRGKTLVPSRWQATFEPTSTGERVDLPSGESLHHHPRLLWLLRLRHGKEAIAGHAYPLCSA
jgi:hypothetical protein